MNGAKTLLRTRNPAVKNLNAEPKKPAAKPKGCPEAVKDVELNTENRNLAIKNHGYGPLNPSEENTDFWQGIGDLWEITADEAKTSRCGNCAAFIQTVEMMACINDNLGLDEDYPKDGKETMQMNRGKTMMAAGLGYCQLFAFKCAAERVCEAWVHGGPITE
jgi:hypothetical protein